MTQRLMDYNEEDVRVMPYIIDGVEDKALGRVER